MPNSGFEEPMPDVQEKRPIVDPISKKPDSERFYLREFRILVCTDEGLIALYRLTETLEIDAKTYLDKLIVHVECLDKLTYFPRIARCVIAVNTVEPVVPPENARLRVVLGHERKKITLWDLTDDKLVKLKESKIGEAGDILALV